MNFAPFPTLSGNFREGFSFEHLSLILWYTENMAKGKFIVLEGGEGSGKSTMARAIAERYGAHLTREPGGSAFAEWVREEILSGEFSGQLSARSQFALLWAARANHIEKFIQPKLEAGEHVVCDRFDGSTFAYQSETEDGHDLHPLFFSMREHFLAGGQPDRYLVFDVPVGEGLRRVEERREKTNIFDDREFTFHERVRANLSAFAELSEIPAKVIDASQSMETVRESVLDAAEEIFSTHES